MQIAYYCNDLTEEDPCIMVEGTNVQKRNLFNLVQNMVQNTIAPVEQTIQARLRQSPKSYSERSGMEVKTDG